MKNLKSVLFLLAILFSACSDKVTIVHQLSEATANQIVVLLAKNSIDAQKVKEEKNQEITWNVAVHKDDQIRAQSLLSANKLPREKQGGLEAICGIKVGTVILTPKQEKCRELLGLKGEIINSLESIPGIVSADVVLNIPEKEDFPDPNTPVLNPTASVTVQYLENDHVKSKLTEGKIQEFVANSVSGMDARDVSVVLTHLAHQNDKTDTAETITETAAAATSGKVDDQPTPSIPTDFIEIAGLKMDTVSAQKFKVVSGLFLGFFIILAIAFIFVLLKMSNLRKRSSVELATDQQSDDQKLLDSAEI